MSEVILAASACRTTITEVYQSGSQTSMTGGNWGCESTSSTSKYVQSIATDANGLVTVTSQNIGTGADGAVTLIPTDSSGATMSYSGTSQTIFKWVCGGNGTTVAAKFLPGSCRGG
jgi:type IV pilus assembly protein PilA